MKSSNNSGEVMVIDENSTSEEPQMEAGSLTTNNNANVVRNHKITLDQDFLYSDL